MQDRKPLFLARLQNTNQWGLLGMIGNNESNAILREYSPSGAGKLTCQGSKYSGCAYSHYLAQADRRLALYIADRFLSVAEEFDFPPALLAGLASRESRCGLLLDSRGWGDLGHAFGIMQIDRRSHTILGQSDPRSVDHIRQAASILKNYLAQIKRLHSTWPAARQLQGAVAAYNVGVKNVRTLEGMDRGTTHDDYSNDVWARAVYFAGG